VFHGPLILMKWELPQTRFIPQCSVHGHDLVQLRGGIDRWNMDGLALENCRSVFAGVHSFSSIVVDQLQPLSLEEEKDQI